MQIDSSNFQVALELFKNVLHSDKTEFVAFDFEMTGIRPWERESTFDLPFERYDKCSAPARKYNLIQAGLTVFHKESENQYTAHPFNAFVIQRRIAGTSYQPELLLEAGGIAFNAKHGMDFDYWIKNSVNYLDRSTKALLEGKLASNANLSDEDKQRIYNSIDSAVGFTHFFEILSKRGVPIVGHNCYFDLLFMHQAFFGPLPQTYCKKDLAQINQVDQLPFKQSINSLFPAIYDTKTISNAQIKAYMPKENNYTSLERIKDQIYEDLERFRSVQVALAAGSEGYDWDTPGSGKKFHEAGFDSYLTGWVFLQLRGIYCKESSSYDTFTATFKNRVNLMFNRYHCTFDSQEDVLQQQVKYGLVAQDEVEIFGLLEEMQNKVDVINSPELQQQYIGQLKEHIVSIIKNEKLTINFKVSLHNKRYLVAEFIFETIDDLQVVKQNLEKIEHIITKVKEVGRHISEKEFFTLASDELAKKKAKQSHWKN